MNSKVLDFNKLLFLDGAMGTMLHKAGLKVGEIPENYNVEKPEVIFNIHRQYIEAGADIITTNTFGASKYKLKSEHSLEKVITKAVEIAKAASIGQYVALDIGPTGHLLAPLGDLSFEDAYDAFAEIVKIGAKAGADLVLIETMSDIYEAKAAVLAAKENCDLPVFCTMTFQENGRTLTGTDPITMVNILQGLGVDALGINCSVGPKDMMKAIKEVLSFSQVPVIIQPNAGIPKLLNGETVFDVEPNEFAACMKEIAELGAVILGGCCGTDPKFIYKMKEILDGYTPIKTKIQIITAVSSSRRTIILGKGVKIIGERINPTGKKKLKEALKSKDIDYIVNEAIDQKEVGAHILDINVGLPEIDEQKMMLEVVHKLQNMIDLPLQIDSMSPEVIEKAVRSYNGKPIINSVNGKEKTMEAIFPIVKKYGACVIGLTLDEKGIPATAEERVAIADRIISKAQTYGIPKENIIIDCLVLTASAQQKEVMETIKAVAMIKAKYGICTALGVSNVSFGLPGREIINRTFLALALGAGLDAPILNPMDKGMLEIIDTYRVLSYEDVEAKDFINNYGDLEYRNKLENKKSEIKSNKVPDKKDNKEYTLKDIVVKGLKNESASRTAEALKTNEPLYIVDNFLIPALDEVGYLYEKGTIFLPQLIQSAETVKASFEVIKEHLTSTGARQISKGKILLATVRGDVHDIGKNIVKVLLENYGFDIVDMGKDVPEEAIVSRIKEENIKLVGLSALMTTTVRNMEDTIKAIRQCDPQCKIMVGGAVLNQEYADMIGADFYAADARDGVKIARSFFGE